MSNGDPPKHPVPNAKPIEIDANTNLNNMDIFKDQEEQGDNEIPTPVLVQLIVIALESLDEKGGSSLKAIQKRLFKAGLVDQTTDLRRAMIVALKQGEVARPVSAVKAGVYGLYIRGDGIPIHLRGKGKGKGKGRRKRGKRSSNSKGRNSRSSSSSSTSKSKKSTSTGSMRMRRKSKFSRNYSRKRRY